MRGEDASSSAAARVPHRLRPLAPPRHTPLEFLIARSAAEEPSSSTAFGIKAIAGTGAGIVSTALCSPLDVAKVRACARSIFNVNTIPISCRCLIYRSAPLRVLSSQTRIQVQTATAGGTKYTGILGSLATIYREEGVRGWYHGFTPAVCSVAVFWTCYFPAYDYAKDYIAEASGLPLSSSLVHMSAAAAAGLLTDIITNPLWVIRTRLATQRLHVTDTPADATAASSAAVPKASPRYLSMRHAFVTICSEEGVMALFSGLSASILGLSHIMIQFPLYERIKTELAAKQQREMQRASHESVQRHPQRLREQPKTQAPYSDTFESFPQQQLASTPRPRPPPSPQPNPMWHIIAASGLSKLVASTITYPHEVVRARLQFDRNGQLYSGLIDATRKTIQKDGFAGLWLGFNLNIVRTIPQSIVTFTLYEFLSRQLQAALGLSAESPAQKQKQQEKLVRTRSEARG